jgi:hypothetical protein
MANVNRNATDASQALAMAGATQGQANQAFGNLETGEAQDYQRRYGNLVGAQQGMIQEGDKVFQDQVRRFQDMAQIKGAQAHNRSAMWQGLGNLGFGMMGLGMAGAGGSGGGGFSGLFGGAGKGGAAGGGAGAGLAGGVGGGLNGAASFIM